MVLSRRNQNTRNLRRIAMKPILKLIVLLILLELPVLLTILHVMLVSRFKTNRLDLRMAEAKFLSNLAQLEKEATSG
jgi:hypothetical protein